MHKNAVLVIAIAAAAGQAAAYPAFGPNARRAAFDAFGPGASATPAVPQTPNAAAAAPPAASSVVPTTGTTTGTVLTNTGTVPPNTGATPPSTGAQGSTGSGGQGLDLSSILDAVEQAVSDLAGPGPVAPATPPTGAQGMLQALSMQQKRDAHKDARRKQIHEQLGGKKGKKPKRDAAPTTAPTADVDPDSEAINIGSLFKIGGDIVSGISSLFGGSSDDQNQRRELLELLARDAADPDSEALNIGSLFKIGGDIVSGISSLFGGSSDNQNQRRELVEMLARQAAQGQDGSEALGLDTIFKVGSAIFKGAESLFGGSSDNSQQSKREFLELFARDVQSGAVDLHSILQNKIPVFHRPGPVIMEGRSDVPVRGGYNMYQLWRQQLQNKFPIGAAQATASTASQVQKRAAVNLEQLMKEIQSNQEVHLNFGTVAQAQAPAAKQARAMLTPAQLKNILQSQQEIKDPVIYATVPNQRREPTKTLQEIINQNQAIPRPLNINDFWTPKQSRRELLELLARDAANADGSEALGIDTIFKVGSAIFKGAESLFGGSSDNNQQSKRELLELLAREAADPESGALGIDTIFKVGSALFKGAESLFGGSSDNQQSSKRAPEPFVVPPGSNYHPPTTFQGFNGFHPLMLATTAAPAQARSLNDLD